MTDYGVVYWITGLSGVGKTTIAKHLVVALRDLRANVVHLDGDRLRAMLGVEENYSREERHQLAFIYVRMCILLAQQGLTVVCSTISLFADVRQWGRENAPNWVEIYLTAPMKVLRARDRKGIYTDGPNAKLGKVAGVQIDVELPERPDLHLENFGEQSLEANRDAILEFAKCRGLLK